jgi:hypothetical protein
MEMTRLARRAALSAGMALVVAIGTADAATMLPHRATYALSAASGVGQKQARVIDGLMIFELSDDCDGHTLTDRTVILLGYGDGHQVTLDSQYSAWESKDGARFRFLTSTRLNGNEVELVRGSAKLDVAGGTGTATFTSPEAKELSLPKGTRFPLHAGIHSLSEIEGGARHLSYILFDGSTAEGPYLASDFVVDGQFEVGEPPTGDLKLLDAPSWHIRTAVFDFDDEAAPPATELEGQTHANGVISGFTLEVDSFAAVATLTKVEALPESGC